jgi:hypothetical protein
MKKILGLIAVLVLILGCDDGDMTFKTFDFRSEGTEKCPDSDIIFKIKDTEVLILKLSAAALVNVSTFDPVTGENTPRLVDIGTSGSTITYRNYTAKASKETLCNEIPPATPSVIDEWIGQGKLSITTKETRLDGRLTGFQHQITLKNITFTKGEETITINDNNFGTVDRKFDFTFNFIPQGEDKPSVKQCDGANGLIYTINGNEALILSLPAGTFPTAPGTKSIDLKGLSNLNRLIFKVFESTATRNYICNTIVTPVVKQHWNASEGEIIITTKEGTIPGSIIHEIRLKNVLFRNAKNDQETFKLSEVIPPSSENYFFGTYSNSN